MYEETDVYERIPYHGRNWSFLRPVFCPQFYTESRRFLAALESNYSRSACSLNGRSFAVPECHLFKLYKWREGEAPPILKPDMKWK